MYKLNFATVFLPILRLEFCFYADNEKLESHSPLTSLWLYNTNYSLLFGKRVEAENGKDLTWASVLGWCLLP